MRATADWRGSYPLDLPVWKPRTPRCPGSDPGKPPTRPHNTGRSLIPSKLSPFSSYGEGGGEWGWGAQLWYRSCRIPRRKTKERCVGEEEHRQLFSSYAQAVGFILTLESSSLSFNVVGEYLGRKTKGAGAGGEGCRQGDNVSRQSSPDLKGGQCPAFKSRSTPNSFSDHKACEWSFRACGP